MQHQESVVAAPSDWPSAPGSRPAEFWYVVGDQQIYDSLQALDSTGIHTDTLILAYDFPLAIGHSRCPSIEIKGVTIRNGVAAGQRTVVSQGRYDTPAGRFNTCYQITEDINSGGVTRWFCDGVGVVAQKYDTRRNAVWLSTNAPWVTCPVPIETKCCGGRFSPLHISIGADHECRFLHLLWSRRLW